MAYLFTSDQIARIRTSFEQAQANGSWADAYELVASIVTNEPDMSGSEPINSDPEVQASRLWLLGAAQANAGEGAFSSLIRDYTERQYELHFGISLSDAKAQQASDAVAEAVIDDILNLRILPTVGQIAEQDATAVGETLFSRTPSGEDNTDDPAGNPDINAAWSGSILFSFFDNGSVASDQTDRLLSTGENDAAFDSLNDLRDVLFAYDAFGAAFNPVELFVEDQWGQTRLVVCEGSIN